MSSAYGWCHMTASPTAAFACKRIKISWLIWKQNLMPLQISDSMCSQSVALCLTMSLFLFQSHTLAEVVIKPLQHFTGRNRPKAWQLRRCARLSDCDTDFVFDLEHLWSRVSCESFSRLCTMSRPARVCQYSAHSHRHWPLAFPPLLLLHAGLHTSLPFPHRVVAGSPTSDPYLLISGAEISSEEDRLYVELKGAADQQDLYLGIHGGNNSTLFAQLPNVMLR